MRAADERETDSWTQHGYDNANTGHASDNTGPTARVTEQWKFDECATIVSPLLLNDGLVFVNSVDEYDRIGYIHAIDAESGEQVWSFETDVSSEFRFGPQFSTPVLSGQTLVAPNENGIIYGIDAATGTQVWETKLDYVSPGATPRVHDGVVYLAGRWVHALDVTSGERLWTYKRGDIVDTNVVIVDGSLYVIDRRDYLRSISTDGTEEWSVYCGSDLNGAITSDGKRVYVSTYEKLLAYNIENGNEQWSYGPRNGLSSSTVANGTVFVSDPSIEGKVRAFDAQTGEQRWATHVENDLHRPVVADGTVYVGGSIHNIPSEDPTHLAAIDAESGEKQWSYTHESFLRAASTLTVANGDIYFLADKWVLKMTEKEVNSGSDVLTYGAAGVGVIGSLGLLSRRYRASSE